MPEIAGLRIAFGAAVLGSAPDVVIQRLIVRLAIEESNGQMPAEALENVALGTPKLTLEVERMFEWLLVATPIAFSALVFTMAIGSKPVDVVIEDITTPEFLEQQGYDPGSLDDILERKISEIVDGAASLHAPRRVDVGTPDTTINAFADITELVEPVRATQRFIGLVDYIAEVHFLSDEIMSGTVRLNNAGSWEFEADQDESLLAAVRIRDSDTLEVVKYEEVEAEFRDIDALLDRIAEEIVWFFDPYTLSLYLYNASHQEEADERFLSDAISHMKRSMPLVKDTDKHWLLNLLCHISNDLGEAEVAIEYCKEAVRRQPVFALAHANWGAALFRLGRRSDAVEHYQAALGMEPDLAIARVGWAEALLREQRFLEALAQLEAAHEVAPEFAKVYELRAAVYEQVGVPELAKRARHRADVARVRQPRQSFYEAL
jgi:tetratricopeptide (TPR) repeat protein